MWTLEADHVTYVSTPHRPYDGCTGKKKSLFSDMAIEQKCSLQKLGAVHVDNSLFVPLSVYLPSLHATCSRAALRSLFII